MPLGVRQLRFDRRPQTGEPSTDHDQIGVTHAGQFGSGARSIIAIQPVHRMFR